MSELDPKRLPRGRHSLSREAVEADQRIRIITGLAESVRTRGYLETSVATIIKSAGVSRETFYHLFDSKLDCFMGAFDFMAEMLLGHLEKVASTKGGPDQKFESALGAYLDALALDPGFARLLLVEVFAAGEEAMARRDLIQAEFVKAAMQALELDKEEEFAVRMLVAAVATMVTGPLVRGDIDALQDLREPILREVRTRFALG
ncbi:MAG TPA: TetR/AcrR family transcriptional regulator [Microthrixaceae bacterium]|nr:TetR/AcrR family transcriptional regulator [Microthrixaceae bacterium]